LIFSARRRKAPPQQGPIAQSPIGQVAGGVGEGRRPREQAIPCSRHRSARRSRGDRQEVESRVGPSAIGLTMPARASERALERCRRRLAKPWRTHPISRPRIRRRCWRRDGERIRIQDHSGVAGEIGERKAKTSIRGRPSAVPTTFLRVAFKLEQSSSRGGPGASRSSEARLIRRVDNRQAGDCREIFHPRSRFSI
jgi:hypothetical protein